MSQSLVIQSSAIKEIESGIDSGILDRGRASELKDLLAKVDEIPGGVYYRLILRGVSEGQSIQAFESELPQNEYVLSRLLLVGYTVTFHLRYLYALADSIITFSPVQIVRWYFILERMVERGLVSAPGTLMLRQSKNIVEILPEIVMDDALLHELKILSISKWRQTMQYQV